MVIDGTVTVSENGVESLLGPGDAACWKAGEPVAHALGNHTGSAVRYIVIGTRAPSDRISYPALDRVLHFDRVSDQRRYTTLDGKPATKP